MTLKDLKIVHHFSAGTYAREAHIPVGHVVTTHKHNYDHLSILASGVVKVTVGGVEAMYSGPAALTILAGIEHEILAMTDAVWFCIHATDVADPEGIDEVLIMKE